MLGAVLGLAVVVGTAATLGDEEATPAAEKAEAPAGLSVDPALATGPARVDYARLDGRIARLMQEPDMVGFAIGTVENGQVRFLRGYGEVLAGSGVPVTPDTVFRWGSVSKGVAAALAAKLAEEGRLQLDAPIAQYGTTLRLPGGSERVVTVADVLSHRTGLVRNAWDDRLEAGQDPRAIRAALATLPPYCLPSTCHQYQNIAYDASTEVIEGVTGQAYGEVARARLFAPLGMASASMDRLGLERSRSWARPHRLAKRPTTVNDNYYRTPAAAGVNASIGDLTRWMMAQMGAAPAVLSPATLDTMHRPRVATEPRGRRNAMSRAMTDAAYGLGWRSFSYAGRRLVGHRGTVDGYGALLLFDSADRSGIAMLWNSNRHTAARLQLEFFDMLYGLPVTDWLELDEAGSGAEAVVNPEPTPQASSTPAANR
ncbi:serine hydrolase domain-containing protein [Sphingomonas lenta]|uniref:Serine hydrolase n=1 Tax=Sphingomonas lenta TaxID=1141887 RepID=A0A2A2SG27_9SPHN|nr:serine hydrolase domain-containing protein [Sphingomonas lenta]PAX08207.1 serine hydrolase [Sphingomonas lenta]